LFEGHLRATADAGEIVRRALKALLNDLARKKFAATNGHLRAAPRLPTTATWGRRCRGVCAGGKATVDNIQLRSRAHNGYEADLEFGERRPGAEWAVHEAPVCYEAGTGIGSGPRSN
jgi:hypothetical protein